MNALRSLIEQIRRSSLTDYFIILLIVSVSAYIRFVPIINGDFPFLYDHGRDMIDVRRIVLERNPTLIGPTTGLQGLFHSPLHYYLLSIAFVATDGNPAGGVGLTVFAALIAALLCFFLGKNLLGRVFGITAAAFYAFAPASISSTTMFWNPYWIPMTMVPFYFCLYIGIFKDKKYLVPAFLFAGIISQFEAAFGIFLLPSILLLLLVFNRGLLLSRYTVVGILLFVCTFVWFPLFEVTHGFNMTKTIYSMISGGEQSLGESIPLMTRVDYRFTELLRMTIYALTWNRIAAISLFFVFILTFGYAILRKNTYAIQQFVFFAFLPVMYFVWFMLFPFPAWSYYWIGLQVGYYFFAAYATSYLFYCRKNFHYAGIGVIIVWLVITLRLPGDTAYTDKQPGTYKNMLAAIDYIYADRGKDNFGVFVYTPPIYTYAYDYLFWWRGETRYNYVPDNSQSGVFYLVIEPNESRPWEVNGWKKQIVGDERPVWSRTLQGDILIERYETD